MPFSHTNRRGENYYIYKKLTKLGNPTYFTSRKLNQDALENLPDGFEIFELPENGTVSLRKKLLSAFSNKEILEVKSELNKNKAIYKYILDIHGNTITIHTTEQERVSELTFLFGSRVKQEYLEMSLRYTAMMRYIKSDQGTKVERYVFRGMGDWYTLEFNKSMEKLVKKYCKHLGKESFFDLI